jgi:diguanylate cyclase (GGDEF)-like protein/PAS domain S-box-containing protein
MLASSARSAKILGRTTTADIEPLVEVMAFDWSPTCVGAFLQWPEALKSAARTAMVSLSPMAVMIGPSGLLISNAAADRLFGDRTRNLGQPAACARPGAASVFDELIANYQIGKASSLRDQPFKLDRDGQFETAWFNIDVVPILDARGIPLGGLMVSFETTEHVREMRTLAQSEERFRLALEASGMVGVWDLDLAKNINTADPAVDSVFGIPPEVAHSGPSLENYIAAIHADDRGRVENAVRETIATGQPYRARYRVAGSDGKERWVIASGKPVHDESGHPIRFPGVIIDITEQMHTAAALHESRFQFETLIEALPQIVWSCDAKGEHDYFSARWHDFTGLPQGSIHPETWKKLVFPEDRQRVFACLDAAMRTGQPYDIEYRFLHHSGDYRWLRTMALPVRNETGRITRWFGTSTDIHDARLLASEREKVSKELERLATLDPLTGVLARRAFFERAETHLAKLTRDRTACILMLDLDHFKQINDTYGHAGGDKALSIFAKRVRNCLRGSDLFGRLGGEEFAILLSSCSERRGSQVAERIRTRLEREVIDFGNDTRTTMTVSIGIAVADHPTHSLEGLLAEADQALYRVKNSGRNACYVWHRDERENLA